MFTSVISSGAEVIFDQHDVLLPVSKAATSLAEYILALRGYDLLVREYIDPNEMNDDALTEAQARISPDNKQRVAQVAQDWVANASTLNTVGAAVNLDNINGVKAQTLTTLFESGIHVTNQPIPKLTRAEDPNYLIASLPFGMTQQDSIDAQIIASRYTGLPRKVSKVILSTVFDIAVTDPKIVIPTQTFRHMLPEELCLPPGINKDTLDTFLRLASEGTIDFTLGREGHYNGYSFSLLPKDIKDNFDVLADTPHGNEPYATVSLPPAIHTFDDQMQAERQYKRRNQIDSANISELVKTDIGWSIVTHPARIIAQITPTTITDMKTHLHEVATMLEQLKHGAKSITTSDR
ncbi:MAG: hypothetical protein WAQ24_00770 [Candidatus Saccharimonadales bacterium]